ncbi:MAG: hypothetical protein Q7R33_10290, partial [Nitrosarchaeum sp.]|nr:hypothetical protein [Nitrosarchaeum sp.]
ETCSFTSRNNCETSGEEGSGGIGFYKGIYCSDSRMSCECRPKFKKGCVEGEEDVFWFDSCGNREGIANDCDYSKGNMCGEVNGDFACKNVDCKDTLDYENNLEHEPRMGGERKNGESWCVYEGRVGPSYDLVGSRHYRHICLNGEELIEPCMDFRGEICLQSSFDDEEFSSAVCLQNQGLECVTECSDGDNEENKKCCKDKSTCVWTADEKDNGVCMPLIPPGLAFWPNAEGRGPSVDAKDICDYGDQKCKSVWEKKIDGWECEVNCDCEKEKWVDDVNNFCRSLGDCGAYYNMNGDLTIDGQSTSGSKTKDLDIKLIEDFSFLKQAGKILLF